MRTVIDIRTASDHFPGIGRYTYDLVRGLARSNRGEPLLLIADSRSTNTRFNIGALEEEPNVRILATAAPPFTVREQFRLPYELRRLSPDVTHFPYLAMPFATPCPFLLTIHDIIPLRLRQYYTFRQRILYRVSLSAALHRARFVICVSETTRSDLISAFRVDSERLQVVHQGISERFRSCAREEVRRVRLSHGFPEEYILYVGSNKPHKNLAALIDAYACLRHAPPLILAGVEDPRYQSFRRRIDDLHLEDRVRINGPVPEEDLPALYSGALAFVFPSVYEGFGLPPLEAMACGVPVACSNIPALCETVGDAALFFNPENSNSIAAALERILQDEKLRGDLKDRGLRRSAEMSWETAVQKTRSLYRRAVNP